MNILVIGSGGREHALCWKIKQSPLLDTLYCAPGNGGIATIAECKDFTDHDAIIQFCKDTPITLVVIGPEQPLVEGLADRLRAEHIMVFGPGAEAGQLEGSKDFTKQLCKKYNIPTASSESFMNAQSAKEYVQKEGTPIVIKADGLAAGKGVIIAHSHEEACEAIDEMFSGKFGEAGKLVVIEEFLVGEEVSFFALLDGNHMLPCGSAQDHKAVGEGDTGPNTGGMGTYSPAPIMTKKLHNVIVKTIIEPTVNALKEEEIDYRGVLFAGCMITKDGPKLLEYNIRFGDPETQVLMARWDEDLLPRLLEVASGTLQPDQPIVMSDQAALCVVMAANGYPGSYEKGSEISNLDNVSTMDEVEVFHAGTRQTKDGRIIANGGRVLGVTAIADTVSKAQARAYEAVDAVEWEDGFCRRDIGWRAVGVK